MKTAFENSKELMQKIIPSMSYDKGDYAEWKNSAREKLYRVEHQCLPLQAIHRECTHQK